MSPSLHSTFLGVTLEALHGCYIIHPAEPTHPQPIKRNKTKMNILWKIHSAFAWFICRSACRILIPSHNYFKKGFFRDQSVITVVRVKISVSNWLHNISVITHRPLLSHLNPQYSHKISLESILWKSHSYKLVKYSYLVCVFWYCVMADHHLTVILVVTLKFKFFFLFSWP